MFKFPHVYGGIVAHHVSVCHKKIDQFFEKLAYSNYDLIVLLGPNHFNIGQEDIQTSLAEYSTPHGKIRTDTQVIRKFLENDLVHVISSEMFSKEHSISGLVPYIRKYLPASLLVPFIFKSGTSQDKCDRIAEQILRLSVAKKILVLASVDFSHYLYQAEANFHDNISIQSINSFDFNKIFNLKLDSHPSIYTLLKYLLNNSAAKMTAVGNYTSNQFSQSKDEKVVSYFFAYFVKGKPSKSKADSIVFLGDIKSKQISSNNLFKMRLFFCSVDLILANIEGDYMEIISDKHRSYRILLDSLLENKIYAMKNRAFLNRAVIKEDVEYLSENNVGFLDKFNHGKNYFIKKLNHGRLGCLLADNVSETSPGDYAVLIKQVKAKVDYLVVFVFWNENPPLADAKARARQLIDQGADIVIGNLRERTKHELHNDKLIIYSLDNFLNKNDNHSKDSISSVGLVFDSHKKNYKYYFF